MCTFSSVANKALSGTFMMAMIEIGGLRVREGVQAICRRSTTKKLHMIEPHNSNEKILQDEAMKRSITLGLGYFQT